MVAVVTTLESEPTGPYVDSLPVVIHSVGVAGYSHRYIASYLTGAADDPVTVWPEIRGNDALTQKSGRPVLADSNGVRGVRFDGAHDDIGIAAFPAVQRTLALVVRILAADGVNTGIVSAGPASANPSVVRTASNEIGLFSPSGAAAAQSTGAAALKQWSALFVRFDTNTAKLRVNASGTDLNVPTNGNGMGGLFIGQGGGDFGQIIVAEAVLWPAVLTEVQLAAVQSSLRQRYPALP